MADARRERKKPNLRQRKVARALRRWRKETGRTLEDVAAQLNWPHARLSRYETAVHNAGIAEIIALATILGIPEQERDNVVKDAAAGAANEGWWRSYGPEVVADYVSDYLESEAEASSLRTVDNQLVPALLQDDGYADALVRAQLDGDPDDAVLQERRAVRLKRQGRLDDEEHRLSLHAVLDEAVLHRPVGGARAMKSQCDLILRRIEQAHITVQLLPRELGAYPGFGAAYRWISFDDGESAVYFENLSHGLYIEEERDVKTYTLNFERLTGLKDDGTLVLEDGLALDPAATTQRITEIRDEWEQQAKE